MWKLHRLQFFTTQTAEKNQKQKKLPSKTHEKVTDKKSVTVSEKAPPDSGAFYMSD